MKGKILGCIAAATSAVVCALLITHMMGILFDLGRAAANLGLLVV